MRKGSFVLTAVCFVIICQLVGALGSLFTFSEIPSWYASLTKPSFNPPNWLFGPVWTLLYTLMGIAGAKLWHSKAKNREELFRLFIAQLCLNGIWTPIFFGAHALFPALAIVVLLDITVAALIYKAWKKERLVSYLLLPYLAWILFATFLNASLAFLNL